MNHIKDTNQVGHDGIINVDMQATRFTPIEAYSRVCAIDFHNS